MYDKHCPVVQLDLDAGRRIIDLLGGTFFLFSNHKSHSDKDKTVSSQQKSIDVVTTIIPLNTEVQINFMVKL